jgi:hypothetical protein
MEHNPPKAFENPSTPDPSGDTDVTKKKKKKTTHLPLAIIKKEAIQEDTATTPRPSLVENLEALLKAKDNDPANTDNKQEVTAITASESTADDVTQQVIETQTQENRQQALSDIDNTKPETTSNQSEVPIEDFELDSVFNTSFDEKLPTQALELPQEQLAPGIPYLEINEEDKAASVRKAVNNTNDTARTIKLPTETSTTAHTAEIPVQDASTAAQPISESLRQTMFDPNITQEQPFLTSQQSGENAHQVVPKNNETNIIQDNKKPTHRSASTRAHSGGWLGNRKQRETQKKLETTLTKQTKELHILKAEHAHVSTRLDTVTRNLEHFQSATRTTNESSPRVTGDTNRQPKEGHEFLAQPIANQKIAEKVMISKDSEAASEQPYSSPAGRRVETSAWHRYEIDATTGKLVDNPELAYGKEFKKEQKQERLRTATTDQARATSVGSTILTGVDVAGTTQSQQASQQPDTHKTSQKGPAVDAQLISRQLMRRTTDPITWIIALLCVIFLLVIGVLR